MKPFNFFNDTVWRIKCFVSLFMLWSPSLFFITCLFKYLYGQTLFARVDFIRETTHGHHCQRVLHDDRSLADRTKQSISGQWWQCSLLDELVKHTKPIVLWSPPNLLWSSIELRMLYYLLSYFYPTIIKAQKGNLWKEVLWIENITNHPLDFLWLWHSD